MLHKDSPVTDAELHDITEAEWNSLEKHGALREAMLQEKLSGGRVRCNICQRRCNIPEGKSGYCMTIGNRGGTIYTTIYGVISSAGADPIEKKPIFHYKPGSSIFSVGTLGCNFRCLFCQNWEIAFADAVHATGMCQHGFLPEDLVSTALETGCQGVAWTYNEPGIWLNYTFDCAKLAKEAGLYTAYITNGYATPEHLDTIAPYLDIYRVDLKSMEDHFYRELIKVPSAKGILETAERAKHKWNMHVECVTNIIPGWNDSESNLRSTARWIQEHLGELTPWHVTRFFPYAKMQDVPPTPSSTLERAVEIGHEEGLKFVYLGNITTPKGENTYCYNDNNLIIKRSGYRTDIVSLTPDGKCPNDGADLNIRL